VVRVFESAMELAPRDHEITLEADHAVRRAIDLGPQGGAFSLRLRILS